MLSLAGFPLTPKYVTLNDLERPFYVCDEGTFSIVIILDILQTNNIAVFVSCIYLALSCISKLR